mmetsp:Transcript_40667/g.99998  ORF Transcript_40667/g.99998 Transcript_40667/m.99998 type:complete len:134 (-) Transcript_40667:230-631(-)
MNAEINKPEPFDAVVVPDGVPKVEITVDKKIPNAVTVKIEREDHTIANLLRMQLLLDPSVTFAGYTQPHPLKHHVLLRVQVAGSPDAMADDDSSSSPVEAVERALKDLSSEMSLLGEHLEAALQGRKGAGAYP